jgi:acrylyl-CoA reductase (NADPH)
VLPFILRAVTLAGINSVDAPAGLRQDAWALLEESVADATVARIAPRTVPLGEAVGVAREVLAGTVAGRVVVDVPA